MNLTHKKCLPCEGGIPPLEASVIATLRADIHPDWELDAGHRFIERTFSFSNFVSALAFVNTVGALAESEGHHPDIEFGWGKVTIRLSTHAVRGLSENDFILAAKIDLL